MIFGAWQSFFKMRLDSILTCIQPKRNLDVEAKLFATEFFSGGIFPQISEEAFGWPLIFNENL